MKKLNIQHLIVAFILSSLLVAFGCNSTLALETKPGNGVDPNKNNPQGKNQVSEVKAQEAPAKSSPPSGQGSEKNQGEEKRGNKPVDLNSLDRPGKSNQGGDSTTSAALPITEEGFTKHQGKPAKGSLLSLDDNLSSVSGEESTKPGKLKKLLKFQVSEGTTSGSASGSANLSKRKAIQGVITSLLGDVLGLSHQVHTDRVTSILISGAQIFNPKTPGASGSATLQVGQRVIVFGDLNSTGQLIAKRIKIIPGKATGLLSKNPGTTPVGSASATPTPSTTASATPTASPTPEPTATSSAEPAL